MLTEPSYQMAIYAYVGAALFALLCLGWWLSNRWRPGWVLLVVCLCAALLLTPVYPDATTDTMAPALVVAGFQLFTDGYATAQGALKPLSIFSAVAVILALVLWLLFLRGRSSRRVARANKARAKAAAKAAGKGEGQAE